MVVTDNLYVISVQFMEYGVLVRAAIKQVANRQQLSLALSDMCRCHLI